MSKTNYVSVKLPQNTAAGATVTSLTNKNGVTLVRVTEDGRDDLWVTYPLNPRRSFEIAWSQLKGSTRDVGLPPLPRGVRLKDAPAPVTDPINLDDEEASFVPVDDKVRVTRPKRKGPVKT